MRTDWSTVRLIIALLAPALLADVSRAEKPVPLRDTGRVVVAAPLDATDDEAAEASLIDVEPTDEPGGVAGQTSDCEAIGAWSLVPPLSGANRFRGNVYAISNNVKLIEYAAELAIGSGAVADLDFVVYEFDQLNLEWVRLHQAQASFTGDGQRAFYSTGLLAAPVQLTAGRDYVIGVAWTSTTVIYNTDTETYPRNFAVGTIDGRVALNNPPSPMPVTVGSFNVNPAGVYSMQLCFTGACCLSNDQCIDVTETNCLLQEGQFSASGVGCLDIGSCPMSRGACCLPSGSCSFINEYKCGTLGGAWTEGVRCDDPSQPCAPRGGCCLSDGSCVRDQTVTQCGLAGGAYRGDDVTCDAFPPCTAGACCDPITDECTLEVTEDDCIIAGGSFAGLGTRCVDDPCSVRGACCVGTTCQEETEAACTELGGVYRGNRTTCADLVVPCGRGACCRNLIGCQLLTETDCINLGGTFRGEGLACEEISPRCPGVCCEAGGLVCTPNVTPELCAGGLGGVFAGYQAVCPDPDADPPDPDPCALVATNTRACCLPGSGECIDYIADPDDTTDDCVFDLDGTPDATFACGDAGRPECPVVVPTGACCDRAALSCAPDVAEADCDGEWTEGLACADLFPVCEPFGACCNADTLTCEDSRTESECCEGRPDGDCATGPYSWAEGRCVDVFPDCAPTGACCDPVTRACEDTTEFVCDQRGHEYSGDGSSCLDTDACRRGACCQRDGGCMDDVLFEDCVGDPGAPEPDFLVGQLCADSCFARGACCSGGECVIATGAACGNALDYAGDGTDCEPDLCSVGACCDPESTNCADQTRLLCEESGWTYRGAGTECVGGECPPPTGACCTSGDSGAECTELTEAECTAASGYYAGDDTVCSVPGVCNPGFGACCDPDGVEPCRDFTELECADAMDYFAGAGTSTCQDDGVCDLGACCDAAADTCITSNEVNCPEGGIFRGVGSACIDGLCPPPTGACCNVDPQQGEELCVDIFESDCTNTGDFYAGDDTSCDESNICLLGGCCQRDGSCVDNVNEASCVPDPGAPPVDFRVGRTCASFCAPRGACCVGDTCSIQGALQCADNGGTYSGDGTDCVDDLCLDGACCLLDAGNPVCSVLTRQACEMDPNFGVYSGAGTACDTGDPNQCNRGACCPPAGVSACFSDTVAALCDDPRPFDEGGDFLEGLTCDACSGRGACCLPDRSCEVVTAAECTSRGGEYSGNATLCEPAGLCVEGSCCLPTGTCAIETLQICTLLGGAYRGAATDCSEPCLGACCDTVTGDCVETDVVNCIGDWTANTTCAELDPPCTATLGACCDTLNGDCVDDTRELDCAETWTANTTCAELNPPCPEFGACCTGTTCERLTEADCLAGGGTYGGDGSECEVGLCELGACCFPDDSCQDVTFLACNQTADGVYQGAGTSCNNGQCPTGCDEGIVASEPPNCAIDARYPTDANDRSIVFGWDTIDLTVNCDASTLVQGDFTVRVEPNDVPAPAVSSVVGSGVSATVVLDGPIPPAHWTCIRHAASGTETCLGFLPGDVDGSRAANATDVLEILDGLNGIASLELYQCEVDRSGVCNVSDTLGVIDLLNGAGAFESWNTVSIVECPTAP